MLLHCKSICHCKISGEETIAFSSRSVWVQVLGMCKVLEVTPKKLWFFYNRQDFLVLSNKSMLWKPVKFWQDDLNLLSIM